MNDREISECLEVGLAAVLEAGPVALEYFRQDPVAHDKSTFGHYDPVTEADRRVEAVIRGRLAERYPAHRIVGEEHGESGSGPVAWYIDPIDGTASFVSGMPTWGILLGLVVDGRAVAGIMHQPYTSETYLASPGIGAVHRAHGGETRLRTRATVTMADATVYSTHPRMFVDTALRSAYDRLAAQCRLQRWGGDCYSLALLAHGCIDLVVEGILMPYDFFPMIPIIERAGGVVTNLAGKPPQTAGPVIAAANAALHAAAMDVLTRSP